MAAPIYKVWFMKYKDAWYQLSKEEQAKHGAQIEGALKQAGGEQIMVRVCMMSNEQWLAWGVEKFPSLEALEQYSMALFNMGHYRYIEAKSTLGIEMPPT